jgi:DNA-binding XRE family transcriptional regulator
MYVNSPTIFFYKRYNLPSMGKTRDENAIVAFGQHLKKMRDSKGISLRELENISDVDHSQIHRIEKGLRNPSLTTLLALAKALEIDVCELVKF